MACYSLQVRDLSTRLNIAFARPSVTALDLGDFALGNDLPAYDYLVYKMSDP